MKKLMLQAVLLAFLGLGLSQTASAHVNYADLNNVGADTPAGFVDLFTAYGWGQGQTPQLATTDDVNWYKFSLTQQTLVSLSLVSTSDPAGDTPLATTAFSLYSGVFVDQSFDTNILIPIPAGGRGLVNTAASFSMTTADNNLTIAQANLRTIDFIASATDGGTGTASGTYLLGPGDYSFIAAGNSPLISDPTNPNFNDGLANYSATIYLTETPAAVPVPGAFWLMSTAVAGLGFFGRRKAQVAS